MACWPKLKREWKTAVVAVVGVIVEAWDLVLSAKLSYVEPLVSPDHQWIIHIGIPVLMLVLRRWKDNVVVSDRPN
jgi:hypothetical protein